jgi:hypothetical protein
VNGRENCGYQVNSAKFPDYFPVSREFCAETGSLWTAPSASAPQSFVRE